MTYEELKDAVRAATGLKESDIDKVFDAQREIVLNVAKTRKEVKLPGFGKFVGVKASARQGRNPKTGEIVQIPERTVLRFLPFDAIKNRLNG